LTMSRPSSWSTSSRPLLRSDHRLPPGCVWLAKTHPLCPWPSLLRSSLGCTRVRVCTLQSPTMSSLKRGDRKISLALVVASG
jgi:hypothetical protein